MKKILFYLLSILSVFWFAACSSDNVDPVKPAGLELQISMQSAITAGAGDEIIFNYYSGKGPLVSDIVVFKSLLDGKEYTAPIKRVDAASSGTFAFDFPAGMPSGRYNFIIRRNVSGTELEKTLGSLTVTSIEREDIEVKDGYNIYGLISDGTSGVPGVVVSDGVNVTVTDSKGVYYLASDKAYGYVFMSIPSGYEADSDGFLPVFWGALKSPVSTAERCDFALNKVANDNFTMFVMGDMHLANRTSDLSQFATFAKDLNSTMSSTSGRKYALTLGDMTWDLYWYSNNFGFSQYVDLMNSDFTGVQFFHTMGNHDNDFQLIGDFAKEQPYRNWLTPTYYSYNIGKVHFIVMDNIDYNTTGAGSDLRSKYETNFTANQMEWLKKDLSYVSQDTPVVISAHAPFYRPANATGWRTGLNGANATGEGNTDDIVEVLKGYKVHFFSGHTHKTFNYDRLDSENLFEHNAGSVCGSWWWSGHLTPGINLAQDGAPGGYTVMTVKGNNISWYYKSTGYDKSYQFRSYDMNEVKKVVTSSLGNNKDKWVKTYVSNISSYGSNQVLLNIWNYDPAWTVSVKENGVDLDVKPVWQYDPLHVIAMTAKRFASTDNPNFTTDPWNHFFLVDAKAANSTLEIAVTDRFGNTYTETMARPKKFSTSVYLAK